MSKVYFDISMSLDGFMTAAKQRPEEPMGEGACSWSSGPSATIPPTGRSLPAGAPALGR